jgi:DNA repair protein RecO
LATEKCSAIILRRVYFQNSSLVLTFLSPEDGIIEAVAKGCRQQKSKLFGILDYCNSGELVYYKKKNGAMHIVSQFDPELEWMGVKSSPLAFATASVMCELVWVGCTQDSSAVEVFNLMHSCLCALESGELPELVLAAFTINFLKESGFSPSLGSCCVCGSKDVGSSADVCWERGGIVCGSCRSIVACAEVSAPVISLMNYVSKNGIENLNRISVNKRQVRGLLSAALSFARYQLGRNFKSVSFLWKILNERSYYAA